MQMHPRDLRAQLPQHRNLSGYVAKHHATTDDPRMPERHFEPDRSATTVPREVFAGLTTFLTMAYILVVQPAILSRDFAGQATGLDPGAVLLATCLASALATAVMGLYAGLPVALAPGMGQNVFFVSVMVALAADARYESPPAAALGMVFVAGVLFLLLTLCGFRRAILRVMSPGLRCSISVGIGVFISLIGLKNGGVIADAPTLVALNSSQLMSADAAVFWLGMFTTLLLSVRRVPGAILLGIVVSAAAAIWNQSVVIDGVIGLPEIEQSAVMTLDISSAMTATGATFIAVFLFMDVFDATGTLVGVAHQAGLLKDGEILNADRAMLADALGTVAGACLGTSTITSYVESAAGVQQGGRTGLTAVTVAVLFLLAILFSPLVLALGSYAPITAPALVIVGGMMFRNVSAIDWADDTEAIPCFLVIIGIPLFFSIADGIALGLIVWPLLKLVRGRVSEVSWPSLGIACLLIAYFLTVRVTV
jgi:AGZA family xanthine/uracil permease-like MFS transporter